MTNADYEPLLAPPICRIPQCGGNIAATAATLCAFHSRSEALTEVRDLLDGE